MSGSADIPLVKEFKQKFPENCITSLTYYLCLHMTLMQSKFCKDILQTRPVFLVNFLISSTTTDIYIFSKNKVHRINNMADLTCLVNLYI